MSQKQAFNWLSEMRVDLPHLKMFQDSLLFDQNSQIQMQQGLNAYILTGFNIATPWSAGNPANSLQVVVSGAIVTLAQDPNGSFLLVPTGTPNETMTSSNTNVTGSFTPSSTNYIAVRFQRPADPTTDDLVAFWDEDAGAEFTQTVPLGLVLNYQFVINTTGFGNNASVCTVQTDAFNNIVSITNCKSGLYRLGSGGSTPNPFNSWTYASSPENPLTATSSSVDPFANNGDWELATEKQWKDAVMSAIKQIRNTAYWYVDGSTIVPGVNLSDLFWDTDASVLTMRGKFIHSQTTPGMLTWSGILNIRGIIGPLTYIIAPGTVTLADTQVAYVELVREQDFQPANTFTFVNGNTTVAATIPITGISSGDWIIFAADNLSAWAQVDTVIGSNITLYEPYAGSTATGKALRAQGSYTMQVADPLNVPASGNSFWIAKRDDNGTITATIAASPTGAVAAGGILTLNTTAPHGINAGQGVQVAGVADIAASYSGIIPGTVTAVVLTANNTGPLGDLITLVFNGSTTISAAITSWNTANPSNQVTLTSGVGTQIPTAGNVQLSGGFTFNGFYEVLTVPTTSSITVQASGTGSATSGSGTISSTATIYLRGIGIVSQGESSSDDSSAIEAILEFIGAAYAGDTQPQYGSTNYVTQGIDLTDAISELDARAGVQSTNNDEDRNLKLILGGDWSFTGAATATDTMDFPNIIFTADIPGTPGNSISLVFNGTYATVTDTADTPNIVFTADYPGTAGNSISLVFNGTASVLIVVEAWNAANPGNTVSYTGAGTVTPAANTWTLSGGAGSTVASVVSAWNTANPSNTVSYTGSGSVVPVAQTMNLFGGATPTLSWSSSAAIQVPGLADSANNIVAASAAFTAFDQVAYVNINRSGAGGTIPVIVAPIASLTPTIGFDNLVIFARYLSDGSCLVGSHSFRLVPGESKALDAGISDQNQTLIGSYSEAQSTPLYPSTVVVGNTPVITAIGKIDNVLSSLTPQGLLVGQGPNNPIYPLAGGTAGNVATWSGQQWISAPASSAVTASYELLNLGLATSTTSNVVAEDTFTNNIGNTITPAAYWGQSFTTVGAISVSDITLYLSYSTSSGTPTGSMYVAIYTNNAGNPGTLLGTSAAINASTITTSAAPFNFTFLGGVPLAATTQYFFVFQPTGVTFNSSDIQINIDTVGHYAGGNWTASTNAGSTWTPAPGQDLQFIVSDTGTNALTVALKQSDGITDPSAGNLAVKAAFRSPTLADGSYMEVLRQTALNLTVPQGATLGLNAYYTFTVTSANVSVGATYTNNGQTFTFVSGAVAQTLLSATGTGAPAASGTLTLSSGTGDATITFSAFTIVPQSIYVYAINNGGTMLLGLSGSGTFDESVTQNVSQIQGSTATVISEQLTNNDLLQFSANNEYAGEKFVAQASGNLNNVVLNLSASGGLTGNLVVELHADSGGSPGTLIETSAPLDSSTITGTETNFTFTFSGSTLLNNGTTYHIVLNTSGVTYGGFLLNISIGDAAAAVMAQSTVNNSTVSTTNNATWWGQEFLTTFSGQVGNVQLTLDWDSGAPLSVGASATTDSSVQSSNTTTWYGESFTATATGQINDATLNLYWDSGTQPTGPMTVQLYSVSGGNPGTLLSTSNSVDAATLTTSTAPIDFTFTGGATLTNGTQYFIVLNTSGVTFNGANIDINQDSTEPYAGGQTTLTTNSGSTWTPQTSNLEFNVNVIGVQPTGPMTVQIYSNSAGNPGTLLGTSNTVNASTLTTSPVLTTFTFPIATSPDLANATDYFLVLNVSGVTFNSSEIDIANDNTGSYAGGTATSTSNSGGTWNPFASNALLFTVMGQSSPGNQEVSTNSGSTWTPSLTSDLYYIINSGGTPSDDIRVLYSSIPLSDVAVRLIGRVTIQEPAPGIYTAAPTALTVKNFKISDKGTVGDVVTSMLSLVQYQSVNGTGWVLMNGQPCANSAYETMTGFTNVPLGAGTVLRMRDYGVGLDQYGDQLPGFYEADTFQNHVHFTYLVRCTGSNGVNTNTPTNYGEGGTSTYGANSGSPGGETQAKSTVCNMFIRIN